MLIADCVRPSRSAATVKLPPSAMATNVRNSSLSKRRSMKHIHHRHMTYHRYSFV
jgi:hypothetical protein